MRASTLTTMNLIDISSWQAGIDLSKLFADNPLDGVIVKATQGTGYVNPDYAKWVKWLLENGKPFGVYHYLDSADPEKQADHFYDVVKPYIGVSIPVADFEGDALANGVTWLRRFLERFYGLSGVKCMIYCSLSVCKSLTGLTDYPLWIAQYADMATVNGFLDKPWQSGSVAPWGGYVMHQYTSCGRLTGYSGNLDFDKFYGTVEDWNRLCGAEGTIPPDKKPVDPYIVGQVLDGKYGTGIERISRLNADGYDGQAVQDKVNELYAIALSCKRYTRGNEEYLNSITKIVRLL